MIITPCQITNFQFATTMNKEEFEKLIAEGPKECANGEITIDVLAKEYGKNFPEDSAVQSIAELAYAEGMKAMALHVTNIFDYCSEYPECAERCVRDMIKEMEG